MSKKVLIVLGHPDRASFCAALAESYKRGALASGAEVREIFLGELSFDPNLRLLYGAANQKALKKATLEFCGIKPVRVTSFGQVKFSDAAKRQKWLAKVEDLGRRLV